MKEYLIENLDGMTYDDDRIYFIAADLFSILVYDFHNPKITCLPDFPEEAQIIGAFEKIVKLNDKIYLFPCFADDIYCFDISENQYRKLNVPLCIIKKMPRRKMLETVIVGEKIYCVCRFPNMVICIDTKKDTLDIFYMPSDLLKCEDDLEKFPFSAILFENKIIYPYGNNIIVNFELGKKIFNCIYLEDDDLIISKKKCNYLYRVCADGSNNLWVCSIDGDVYEIVGDKKKKLHMPDNFIGYYYEDDIHGQPGIDRMFAVGMDICFTLRSECKILRYNIVTGQFIWCENDFAKYNENGRKIFFLNQTQIDDETFFEYNKNDGIVYKWNYMQGFTGKIEFIVSEHDLRRMSEKEYWRVFWLDHLGKENDLNGYILHIENLVKRHEKVERLAYGKSIYNAMK